METIKIDNRDTKYTIDTYGTFNGEGIEDYMLDGDDMANTDGTDGDYDNYDWDFDHAEIIKAFAKNSIDYITTEGLPDQKVIQSIEYISSGSPKFYNYTTDYYCMEVKYDGKALEDYLAENTEAFQSYAKECDMEKDALLYKLTFYMDQFYDRDNYIMTMAENEMEIYMENCTVTKKITTNTN
jgi:hypothetical protein